MNPPLKHLAAGFVVVAFWAGALDVAGQVADSVATGIDAAAGLREGARREQTAFPDPVADSVDGEAYLSLAGRRATIHFSRADSLVAERVRAIIDGMAPLAGLPPDSPSGVHVVLAHSPPAFDELTGGGVPEWRAGVAIPDLGMLVMPTGEGVRVVDGEGLTTLRHEWAHLGLHGFLGDLRAPRWFDEGYAQWVSGGFDVAGAWRLRVLIARGRAPPMDSLALRWPIERDRARTAYLLAASAVARGGWNSSSSAGGRPARSTTPSAERSD